MRYSNFFFLFMGLSLSVATVDAQDARGAADPSGTTTIGTSLSVQQAVAIAIKNNLLVNQADIQSQTNKVQYDQAWGNMLPQINGQASQQIGFGRTLNSYDYTYVNKVNTGNYVLNIELTQL